MIDLSSTLFFKAQFDVTAKEEDIDILWRVVYHIRNWMATKWEERGEIIPKDKARWLQWEKGGDIYSEHGKVKFQSVYHEADGNGVFWACRIHEYIPSQNGCAPRFWTTEVGFESPLPGKATVSIVIYYSDRPGFIGPCEPAPSASVPKLISLLCKDAYLRCAVDDHELTLKPVRLMPGGFQDFWELVSDPERTVPIVYISPRKNDAGKAENLIDPKILAGSILGPNALVYYAANLGFSREMYELCPYNYGCYAGAVRVYLPHPHVGEEGDYYRHRFFPARDIMGMGSEQICEILRRSLAQDVYFYENMFRVEDCQDMIERRMIEERMEEIDRENHRVFEQRLEEIDNENRRIAEERLEEDKRKKQLFEQRLEEYKRKTDEAKDAEVMQHKEKIENDFQEMLVGLQNDLNERGAEIKGLRKELSDSQGKNANQQNALREERNRALKDIQEKMKQYPDDPVVIAEYFVKGFPDRIDFTEQGWDSLCDCKTAARALWDALHLMVTTLYDLFESDDFLGLNTIAKEFNKQNSKYEMAPGEKGTTHKNRKAMRERKDVYEGQEINIEPHIKGPNDLRIYFAFYRNEKINKIVIGSCGVHLKTSGSSKRHER